MEDIVTVINTSECKRRHRGGLCWPYSLFPRQNRANGAPRGTEARAQPHEQTCTKKAVVSPTPFPVVWQPMSTQRCLAWVHQRLWRSSPPRPLPSNSLTFWVMWHIVFTWITKPCPTQCGVSCNRSDVASRGPCKRLKSNMAPVTKSAPREISHGIQKGTAVHSVTKHPRNIMENRAQSAHVIRALIPFTKYSLCINLNTQKYKRCVWPAAVSSFYTSTPVCVETKWDTVHKVYCLSIRILDLHSHVALLYDIAGSWVHYRPFVSSVKIYHDFSSSLTHYLIWNLDTHTLDQLISVIVAASYLQGNMI